MKKHKIKFYKYQGTGNDFIMIDNRDEKFPRKNIDLIHEMCHRRFGIGADGLILLENDNETDFKMTYFNSDGNQSTMCGNGGRCLVAFAHYHQLFSHQCTFRAIDGLHEAQFKDGIVKLKMMDVEAISTHQKNYILDTGSPHYVHFIDKIKNYNVYENGKKIRNSSIFKDKGINVNFVEKLSNDEIFVRTYERGVEDETYSCGTGVTASSLTVMLTNNKTEIKVKTLGGNLKVYAEKNENGFKNIWLEGPAIKVFEGHYEV